MANRVFVCAVVALWLGSMSWLMIDKVLPSFHEGEPPLAAGYQDGIPVAWKVFWGDRQVGYAASVRMPGVLHTTNIQNRVVLEDVPLLDLLPALMRRVVGDIGRLKFDASTTLEFDSLDNFSRFTSKVALNDISPVLDLSGHVNGAFLELKVHFGEVTYEPRIPIGDKGALNEALLPDAKLPYLYVGRRWSEEVYNPFRAPSAPVETVDVEVTGIETIDFGGENHRTLRVEFFGPPSPGVSEEARLQAIAWVRASDGMVLQQDVIISTSKLRFIRMSDEQSIEIGKNLLSKSLGPRERYAGRRGRWRGGTPPWLRNLPPDQWPTTREENRELFEKWRSEHPEFPDRWPRRAEPRAGDAADPAGSPAPSAPSAPPALQR
ncbi:MAG: hypothetical protein IT424_14055 [Pirellulales bacterium]|nr:hypothetical protein [Pirellulales bacterium]